MTPSQTPSHTPGQTPSRGDRLVEDYLARLERAAQELPAQRRAELLTQVREHIAAARAETAGAEHSDEAAVRNALDALGTPEDIAAVALGEDARVAGARPGGRSTGQGSYDLVAVLPLLLGVVLVPVVGWLAGVALLWASRRWSIRDKVLGTLIVPLGLGAPLQFVTSAPTGGGCIGGGSVDGGPVEEIREPLPYPAWVLDMVLVVLVAAPLVMAIVLLRRAGRADQPAQAGPRAGAVRGPPGTP